MEPNKAFDLLTLGEILLRLSPHENERLIQGDDFRKQIGGAELNVAAGVSLLGLRTGMISKLPEHAIGMYAKNRMRFMGVSDDYLTYDSDADARIGIYYYENGAYPRKPGIVYDRKNTSINKIDIRDFSDEMYRSTRCFHTSGITLALSEQARTTAVEMMKRFKREGALISFDVNFRANLWSGDEARSCITEILPYVDIFFCSEDTARLTFLKEGSAREILKSFTEEYPISIVASTQRIVHSPKVHSFGSVIYHRENDTFYEEPPYDNIEVVDRIGSGDAYVAGVLYGILQEQGDCRKAIEYGNATSAVKNTIPGDLPSSELKEILSTIREHQGTGPKTEMNR